MCVFWQVSSFCYAAMVGYHLNLVELDLESVVGMFTLSEPIFTLDFGWNLSC